MSMSLPLDQMSVADKLRLIEEVWQDLCLNPDAVPSPPWHGDVLDEREALASEGAASWEDWSEAKSRIRRTTR